MSKLELGTIVKTCFWEYLAVEKHVTGSGITTRRASLPTLAYYIENIGFVNNFSKDENSKDHIAYIILLYSRFV